MSARPQEIPIDGITDPHDPDLQWSASRAALWSKRYPDRDWRETRATVLEITPERVALWARLFQVQP